MDDTDLVAPKLAMQFVLNEGTDQTDIETYFH